MKKFTKEQIREIILDWGISIVGVLLLSIGVTSFSASSNIAPGGVSGISILVNYLTGVPIGTVSLLINIPLFIIAFKLQSKGYVFKTICMVLCGTLFMDVLLPLFPQYSGDHLLAALFGGAFMGLGLGLVFWRGFSTGGTDIIAQLINKFNPHLQIGILMGILDVIIIASSALVYRNIETSMYALINVFTCSALIDVVVYGFDKGRMVLIISKKPTEITKGIFEILDRGATVLKGAGAYTGEEQPVILCAVYRNQFHDLKKLVHSIDESAFVIACESNEVLGYGFKPLAEKQL